MKHHLALHRLRYHPFWATSCSPMDELISLWNMLLIESVEASISPLWAHVRTGVALLLAWLEHSMEYNVDTAIIFTGDLTLIFVSSLTLTAIGHKKKIISWRWVDLLEDKQKRPTEKENSLGWGVFETVTVWPSAERIEYPSEQNHTFYRQSAASAQSTRLDKLYLERMASLEECIHSFASTHPTKSA